ncbi:hypothetical protein [Priestia megaterium]|uniref:hypothetical protein n=1 Tax=Priestia megaterium TaxID=1404 RepID=UPI0006ABA516|nr:hypothetical protein [Priestia megaterium]KOP75621.1 hypothetical protein AMS61_15155 [Bacillus sp. FJAT-21351]USL23130.1 hypothetical protein LIT33_17875 [Priestia megaterium]
MSMGILSLITFVIWFVAIQEFLKPEKNQSNRKIMMLTSAGSFLFCSAYSAEKKKKKLMN